MKGYLYARNHDEVIREDKSGKGYGLSFHPKIKQIMINIMTVSLNDITSVYYKRKVSFHTQRSMDDGFIVLFIW